MIPVSSFDDCQTDIGPLNLYSMESRCYLASDDRLPVVKTRV